MKGNNEHLDYKFFKSADVQSEKGEEEEFRNPQGLRFYPKGSKFGIQ